MQLFNLSLEIYHLLFLLLLSLFHSFMNLFSRELSLILLIILMYLFILFLSKLLSLLVWINMILFIVMWMLDHNVFFYFNLFNIILVLLCLSFACKLVVRHFWILMFIFYQRLIDLLEFLYLYCFQILLLAYGYVFDLTILLNSRIFIAIKNALLFLRQVRVRYIGFFTKEKTFFLKSFQLIFLFFLYFINLFLSHSEQNCHIF